MHVYVYVGIGRCIVHHMGNPYIRGTLYTTPLYREGKESAMTINTNSNNTITINYNNACEALLRATDMEEAFAVRLYRACPEASRKAAWARMEEMASVCVDEAEMSEAQAGRHLLGMASASEGAWWQDKAERQYLRRAQDLKETLYWRVAYLRYLLEEARENVFCPECGEEMEDKDSYMCSRCYQEYVDMDKATAEEEEWLDSQKDN
jgi:NADH pyrophosphatase NudC (nudix superfamily)